MYRLNIYKNCYFLSPYSNEVIRAAVHENKFQFNPLGTKILSTLLNNYEIDEDRSVILIPIPLSAKRNRERGHNQVETIINISKYKNLMNHKILKKKIDTKPQSHLDKSSRSENLKGSFVFVGNPEDFRKN